MTHAWIRPAVSLGLSLFMVACGGGSSSPTAPTAPAAAATRIITIEGSLAFGDVVVGQTRDATITIRNSGTGTMTLSGITASGGATSQTTASPTTGSIPAGGSLTITFRYTPTGIGSISSTVTFTTDHTSGTNTLSLSGSGVADPAARYLLDGRVRESAPTSGTTIAGAVVRVVDGANAGASSTADGNAYYVFPSLLNGTFNVQVSAAGYETRTQSVQLTANRNLDLSLTPVLRVIDEVLSGTLSGGSTTCTDNIIPRPCQRFTFGVHHNGTAEAVLAWSAGVNDLDLELWRGTTRLASSAGVSRTEERVSSAVTAGSSYQWRVVYYSGSTVQGFTLTVRRPN